MQKILILAFLISTAAFSQVVNTNWQYHPRMCRAETVCSDGRVIWCQTVGFNYGNAPATYNNMCRTRVVPGALVHCQGYSDQVDAFGRVVFVPTNLPVSCY